jgi:hypothetical protein
VVYIASGADAEEIFRQETVLFGMAKSENHGADEAVQVKLLTIDGCHGHIHHERPRSPITNYELLACLLPGLLVAAV